MLRSMARSCTERGEMSDEIDVTVIVLDGRRESVKGIINAGSSAAQIEADVCKALKLAPDQWSLAIRPADRQSPLAEYRPRSGDTLFMVPIEMSRPNAFRLTGTDSSTAALI
jgi:hypothetical protein